MATFSIDVLSHDGILNPSDDNVDVEIVVSNGAVYSATFFTIENLRSLMKRYRESGECAGGVYLWAADMIIVNTLTLDNIKVAVQDLLKTGEIESACRRIK